jgi:methyl-accepting chemotaxis protein
MIMRKLFYGVRGTVLKSMVTISIAPLVITTVILYTFIDSYSQKIAENSLHKSVNYAKIVGEILPSDDNSKLIELVEKTKVSGGGFFFIMDANGTYVAHPSKKGESDSYVLSLLQGGRGFFKYKDSQGEEIFVSKEFIPERNLYIAAAIPRKDTMSLQKAFGELLLLLIFVTPPILFMISFFIARYIKNPMRQIIDVAHLASQGDLSKFIIQPQYVKCSEIKNCDKKECPAFSTSNKACWGISGTLCYEGMEDLSKEEKIKKFCCDCNVYHKSIKSEFDELIDAVNTMIVTTQNVVASIKKVSAELNTEAETLASTSSKLELEMQNQAGYIEETTSSNEELAASIDSISNAAKNQASQMAETMKAMDKLYKSSAKVSEQATDVSQKTQAAVKNANETKSILDSTTSKINQISENSRRIVEIIRIINDISEQINLLSLNASIEAARAGEHGRGFAVVAEEISKLADATASSTKEIEKMIQQTGSDVNEGARLVNTTNEAINQMIENIKNTATLIEEIALASKDQRTDSNNVLKDIDKVNQMSSIIAGTTAEQQHSSNEILKALSNINESILVITNSSENVHNSAEKLKEKAVELKSITDYFIVDKRYISE